MYRPLLHVSVLSIIIFTLWYDQKYLEFPFPAEGYNELPWKARYAFITYWGMYLLTVYFIVALLNDFFGTNEPSPRKKPFVRTLRDLLFSLAFPAAAFVSFMFWTIYIYDKKLIVPDYVARKLPLWANLVGHAGNLIFVVAEMLVSTITYPSRRVGLAFALVFNNAYAYCLISLRLRTGAWIYPFMEAFDTTGTVALLIGLMCLGLGFYFLGERLCTIRVQNVKQVKGNNLSIKKTH